MAFQPINFRLNQPSPLSDLAQGLMQGMQFRGQLGTQSLRDKLLKSELEQAPELAKSRNLINSLREMQLAQAQREADPQKKMDWINQFAEMIGKGTPEAQAFTRSQLGIPQVTAAEDLANKLRLLERKSELATKKSGMDATQGTLTQTQGMVESINNTLPQIEELIKFDEPFQLGAGYHSPNIQADYDARVAGITDALVGALNLPKTNESLATVEKMVRRNSFETQSAYKKRLSNLVDDLKKRRGRAQKVLQGEGFKDEPQVERGLTQILNPKTGKVHLVPEKDVQAAIKAGGRRL
jgi:hypothetical protein